MPRCLFCKWRITNERYWSGGAHENGLTDHGDLDLVVKHRDILSVATAAMVSTSLAPDAVTITVRRLLRSSISSGRSLPSARHGHPRAPLAGRHVWAGTFGRHDSEGLVSKNVLDWMTHFG
jgi:hypothetical protein